jgi:hypothetical protein
MTSRTACDTKFEVSRWFAMPSVVAGVAFVRHTAAGPWKAPTKRFEDIRWNFSICNTEYGRFIRTKICGQDPKQAHLEPSASASNEQNPTAITSPLTEPDSTDALCHPMASHLPGGKTWPDNCQESLGVYKGETRVFSKW